MKKSGFFTRHLDETGESYLEHFLFTFSISLWLVSAGIIHLLHSFFPFIMPTSASRHVKKINLVLQKRISLLEATKKAQEEENKQPNKN